jgi:hypothetical protein
MHHARLVAMYVLIVICCGGSRSDAQTDERTIRDARAR